MSPEDYNDAICYASRELYEQEKAERLKAAEEMISIDHAIKAISHLLNVNMDAAVYVYALMEDE